MLMLGLRTSEIFFDASRVCVDFFFFVVWLFLGCLMASLYKGSRVGSVRGVP